MRTRPNGYAPTRDAYKLGAKGGFTAQAWQVAWDNLSTTEWRNADEIAKKAARLFAIKPTSVRAQMYAAHADGYLESELRSTELTATRKTKRGSVEFTTTRKVTFYRIKKMGEVPAA